MEYRRFGDTIVCRLQRGEEIHKQLEKVATAESVTLAEVRGIGAIDDFTVGCYDVNEQKYYKNHFTFPAEITMLYGNITTMDGKYYAHIHLTAADKEGHAFGGHLNEARIFATGELFIRVLDGTVEREKDERIGLNVFRFLD